MTDLYHVSEYLVSYIDLYSNTVHYIMPVLNSVSL